MESSIALLKTFIDLMNSGRYEEAREMVSDEVTISEPPGIPYGGRFEGMTGFDEFRRIFGTTWKSWSEGPIWFAEAEGTAVKLSLATAVRRGTGETYTTPLAEFFTFRDGKLVDVKIFYQDIPAFLAVTEDLPARA